MPTNQLLTSLGRELYHSSPAYFVRAMGAALFGGYKDRERLGLLKRPEYAYGIWRAYESAREIGCKSVVVCEFGVATGRGLLNMIDLAERLRTETKFPIRVVGFDTGEGLTSPTDYRDHPELWSSGDYRLPSREELMKKIGGRGEVYWGPIRETMPSFLSSLSAEAPLGFASIDVDFYSSTVDTLQVFEGAANLYTPGVSCYFDDTEFFSSNAWCGELAAVREFNERHAMRKIDRDYTLPGYGRTMLQKWYSRMLVAHILDHPARQPKALSPAKAPGQAAR